jgi:hypothetical protein
MPSTLVYDALSGVRKILEDPAQDIAAKLSFLNIRSATHERVFASARATLLEEERGIEFRRQEEIAKINAQFDTELAAQCLAEQRCWALP